MTAAEAVFYWICALTCNAEGEFSAYEDINLNEQSKQYENVS